MKRIEILVNHEYNLYNREYVTIYKGHVCWYHAKVGKPHPAYKLKENSDRAWWIWNENGKTYITDDFGAVPNNGAASNEVHSSSADRWSIGALRAGPYSAYNGYGDWSDAEIIKVAEGQNGGNHYQG